MAGPLPPLETTVSLAPGIPDDRQSRSARTEGRTNERDRQSRRRWTGRPGPLGAILLIGLCIGASAQDQRAPLFPFHLVDGQPGVLALDGPILTGTATQFVLAMETMAEPPSRLLLNSPGGVVEEALLVADAIRIHRIETEVPAGASCQSACTMIFFAGVGRTVYGEFGVHRPATREEGVEAVGDPELDVVVRELMLRFGADPALVDLAWATPPDEMYLLTPEDIAAYGVNRSREEGLRLAEAEDYPAAVVDTDVALALQRLNEYVPGLNFTIRRAGMPDEQHAGAVRWELDETNGVALASVFVADLNVNYLVFFAPLTDADLPVVYGGFLLLKVGTAGPVPLEPLINFGVILPEEDAGGPARSRIAGIQFDADPSSVTFGFSRLARELNMARLTRATQFQLNFSLDGVTEENTISILVPIDDVGRDALTRAFAAWTGE